MDLAIRSTSTLSPSLPDAMMQVSMEPEQNRSVSYLNCCPWILLTIARFTILSQVSLGMSRMYSSLVAILL